MKEKKKKVSRIKCMRVIDKLSAGRERNVHVVLFVCFCLRSSLFYVSVGAVVLRFPSLTSAATHTHTHTFTHMQKHVRADIEFTKVN